MRSKARKSLAPNTVSESLLPTPMVGNLFDDRIIEEQPSLRALTRNNPAVARPSSAIRDGDWHARQGQFEERDAELAGNASKLSQDGILGKMTG
jgi:hypothetical protein